jgi:hypothetical protein
VSCHGAEGIASPPLTSYEEIAAAADRVKLMTTSRVMPPWGVDSSGDCNEFEAARWLSDDEIERIARWVDDGAPNGGEHQTPVAVDPPQFPTIDANAFASMTEAYVANVERDDDYRCFVIDPQLEADGYITGYDVHPGDVRVVHHVLLFTIDTDAVYDAARTLDDRDEGPGYTCYGGSRLPLSETRLIAGWAPGTGATRFPEGTGIPIDAGRSLVMQIHYYPDGRTIPDLTRVELEVVPSVERPAIIVGAADLAMAVPAGLEAATTDPVQVRIPGIGAFVHGVFPHMHKRGLRMQASLVHPDDRRTCLTRVDRWDFDWQQFYFLESPLYGASTDRIELSCTFDTRGATGPVRWGEGTDDEMCLLGLYVTLN